MNKCRILRRKRIMKKGAYTLAAAFLLAGSLDSTAAQASDLHFLYNGDTVSSKILCKNEKDCNRKHIAYLNGDDFKRKDMNHHYSIKLKKGTFSFKAKRMYNDCISNPSFDEGPVTVSYVYNAERISYKISLYTKRGKKVGKSHILSFGEKDSKKNVMKTGNWKIEKGGTYRIKIQPCKKKYGSVYIDGYFFNKKSK